MDVVFKLLLFLAFIVLIGWLHVKLLKMGLKAIREELEPGKPTVESATTTVLSKEQIIAVAQWLEARDATYSAQLLRRYYPRG